MDTPRSDNMRADHLDGDASAADAAERIKHAAAGAVNAAKNVASEALGKGAEQVERSTHSAASALRRASAECQDEHAWIGTALRKSADGLDRASNALAGGDMHSMFDDVNGFARRQPALFLGISLALGFAAARVGKTAIERASHADQNDPHKQSDAFGAV